MRSSNAFFLIILLSILTSVITIWPMVKSGVSGVFYTIDPDVQYLSNSFSYIEKGQIQYDVHPGTPTIILHAISLWPLRIYTKLINHQTFMYWTFNNVSWVYYYVRIFQSLWLGVAMGIFLMAIYVYSGSMRLLVPVWLGLFTYTVFPYFGSTIVPETTSFFLVSLWLLVFSLKHKRLTLGNLLTLSLISGVTIANKFSNLTLLPLTVLLAGYVPKLDFKKWLKYTSTSILAMVISFFVVTWPIKSSYAGLWSWVSVLASTTGTHGGGKKAIFDLTAYLISSSSLVHRESWPVIIIASSLGVLLIMVVLKKIRLKDSICTIGIVALLAAVVYSKFPLSHYQMTNFVMIVYVGSVLMSRMPSLLVLTLLIILLPPASANLVNYGRVSLEMMSKATILEKYVDLHPSQKGVLWEWARNKDFSFLWGRDWAHGVFDKELGRYRAKLLAISSDMNKIKVNNRELKEVFEVCWDKFYVQSVSAQAFLTKYNDKNLKYTKIPQVEDIVLIESDHCHND